jgi:hypothetical protein
VPEAVGNLTQLDTLDLDDNKLTRLPESVGNLTRLTTLDLSFNQLTALPETVGNLTQLNRLHLAGNQLTRLPESVGNLTQLNSLDLSGNGDFVSPPPEVCAGGAGAVLVFLQELQRSALLQWSSKMLVVGEPAVGKTSVSKALCGLPYDRNEPQTHGVHVDELTIVHPQLADTRMALNVWDFGGQLHYRATQRFYMTDRSLFVLVWNSRKGWEEGKVEAWLQTIGSTAPTSPILVVATHCTDSLVSAPSEAVLRQRYPRVAAMVRLDCEDQTGIAELRDLIAREAAGLPLMGERWPGAWVAGADGLEREGGRHITRYRAEQLLEAAGVVSPRSRMELLRTLHDRGQILHYAQDPQLQQLVFLRPAWVDSMITRVLDSQQVRDRGGVLGRAQRDTLWRDLDDVGLWEALTVLMERFDLAYRIDAPDHQDVALVVEHLPAWGPVALPEVWETVMAEPGASELRVHYRLDSRQAGIPSWFIAREHEFSTGTAWASGVFLEHRGVPAPAWALLQDDGLAQPTVRLTVRGPDAYTFYSRLHEAFVGIVADRYPGLGMRQIIPCPCQDGAGSACRHEFDFDFVREARREGQPLQCQMHPKQWVDPRKLLLGLEPYNFQAAEERMASAAARIAQQTDGLDAARLEERSMLVIDAIRDLQRYRSERTTRCPSLFDLEKIGWPVRYRLSLKCEAPQGPHLLPDGAGVYEFNSVPEWVRSYAPHLRILLTVLQHAVPLVGPALVGVLGETVALDSRSRLELTTKLLDELAIDSIPPDIENPSQDPGVDFAELRKGLLSLDPDFGGLRERVLPESGKVVYLCTQHRNDLHYPAVISAPAPPPATTTPLSVGP